MPKVSVIIPTHNRVSLLERAIQSILSQTFYDFELIIINDASTDSTQEMIKEIDHPRIHLINHSKNRGASAARNAGITASKGKYIAFLDDDDEWLPEKLAKQVQIFENLSDKTGLIYSGFHFISQRTGAILKTVSPQQKGDLYKTLLRRNLISTVTSLIKKDCFRIAGTFDQSLPSCQDWDLWIRISKHFHLDFVPDPLAKVYLHGEQISVNIQSRIQARDKLIQKYHSELIKYPTIFSFLQKRIAILHCLNSNHKKALEFFLKSLKHEPLQRDVFKHIFLTLFFPKYQKNKIMSEHIITLDGISLYY